MSPVIVDIIREVVDKVSNDLTCKLQMSDQSVTGVHYLHGHPLEVIDTLRQRDKSRSFKFDKYPLVALFQDFPEVVNSDPGIAVKTRLHVIIAKSTRQDYKSDERYAFNFKPFLYPIYERFMRHLDKHKAIMSYGNGFPHTKTDRMFWGREGLYTSEGNVFEDFLDCIEIRNLELKIYQNYC